MENNFPLQWPVGVNRTKHREPSAFANRSIAEATKILLAELERLRASQIVLSTNLALRKSDGYPKSDQRALDNDPGIAVYFTLKQRRICMPCDRWNNPADNLHAIALHIASMRGQERWGVGSIEQAFAGYAALPAPTASRPWREVMAYDHPHNPSREGLQTLYRALARLWHPDMNGGNTEKMTELNQAMEAAKKELGY